MDERTWYLIGMIVSTIIILGGLGIVIYGMVKKKVKLIAIGVFVALVPALVEFFSTRIL